VVVAERHDRKLDRDTFAVRHYRYGTV
jgi:hypothetical protein